ncbi:MAG: zinc ribbon domain-containing protein [bacterium]|nr:zinc ribbon domain-containing protein [bacterium]
MKCPFCDKELIDNSKHCVACGKTLFKKCSVCKKVISTEDKICEFCRTDISLYEKEIRFLAEAKEFEQKHQYEKAKAKYESIQSPHLIKEATEKLKRVDSIIGKISVLKEESKKLFESEHLLRAHKAFAELHSLLPDDSTEKALELINAKLKARFRSKIALIVVGVVLVCGGCWIWHINSLPVLATKELHSLLNSPNLDVRNSSALILGLRGDKKSASLLKVLSHSENEMKRIYSLAALTRLDDNSALKDLRSTLCNGSTSAKLASAWIFVNRGDTTVLPYLGYFMDSKDIDLRIGASVLLLNLKYSNGLNLIDSLLKSDSRDERFKVLYAFNLLGNKEILYNYSSDWIPYVKPLINDSSENIKVLAASMLRRFSATLTSKELTTINKTLMDNLVQTAQTNINLTYKMPLLNPFYLVRGLATITADEDLTEIEPSVAEIRQKSLLALSKIQLGDKSILPIVRKDLISTEPWNRLYSAIVSLKLGKYRFRTNHVLRSLLKSKQEITRLNTSKLIIEFVKKSR